MTVVGEATHRRQKILWVTRNLPPLVGGMERFNQRVLEQLGKQFDVAVCGPSGCGSFLPGVRDLSEVPLRPLPLFIVRMLFASLRTARRFKPDIVIAGSGLTAPIALVAARSVGARALVFLYGLDLVVSNRLYQWLWIPAIRACDGFIAISRHTHDLAVGKQLRDADMATVNPGVDPPADHGETTSPFRATHDLGDRPILLSVGRLTRRKGLVEFIRECLPRIVLALPDVVLVVVGGEPADALAGNRGGVSSEIRALASELGIERHVLLLGRVSDAEVAAAYRASTVHVFPVRDTPGDVEGFGLVALDAAMAGVPTVAFAVGGIPDAIEQGVSGILVAPGDYAQFTEAVLRYVSAGLDDERRRACIAFARRFEWDRMGVEFRAAISRLGRGR